MRRIHSCWISRKLKKDKNFRKRDEWCPSDGIADAVIGGRELDQLMKRMEKG